MAYFLSKIIWLFHEYSLFFTIAVFALLTIVVFTLGYLLGAVLISDGVNRRKLKWRKRDLVIDSGKQIFYFFTKKPAASFCKVIPRMSGMESYNMSFFEYQCKLKKIRRLFGSVWIVLSIKFLVFFMTLAVFTNNPWRANAQYNNGKPAITIKTPTQKIVTINTEISKIVKQKIKIADLVKKQPASLKIAQGFALVPNTIFAKENIPLTQRMIDFFFRFPFQSLEKKANITITDQGKILLEQTEGFSLDDELIFQYNIIKT